MGKADLHIHTREGDGVDPVERILDYTEASTDLDVIAITEHDDLRVALRARDLWSRGRYRFDFVPGVEVTTLQGHLVALYLEEPVESLRPIEETLDAVHRQGGVCFIPHPGSWLTRSIGPATMSRVESRATDGVWFDGIELASMSPPTRPFLNRARQLNRMRYRLPAVGASDAHFVQAIGSAYTSFDGTAADDLKRAFTAGAISGHQARYPSLREVGLRRAVSVPIAGLGATPRRLGWRRTTWSFVSRYFS
jgi:predicted metal-dependent phosphoesterase TrpH